MRVRVEVRLREGIADPEGSTIARALRDLGYREVGTVRTGRSMVLELDEDDPGRAADRAAEMCERLLANPVMEDYEVHLVPEQGP